MQPATLLGLMMIAACWLALVYVLSIEHGKTVAASTQQADNFARLFAENTFSTFTGVDHGLLLLREAYEKDPDHRTGPGYLNNFSASISGASAGVRPPCGGAAG